LLIGIKARFSAVTIQKPALATVVAALLENQFEQARIDLKIAKAAA
jgi:hypothetical protein